MNLFVKIFLWFLAAIALMVGVVIFLTWTTQSEPVVSRWQTSVRNQTNIYSSAAAQIYGREGENGLNEFLKNVRSAETIEEVGIIDGKNQLRFSENPNPGFPADLIAKAFASDAVEIDYEKIDAVFAAKNIILPNGEKAVFAVKWDRPKPVPFFGEANYRYMRLLGLILTSLLVCYVFALYLSSPIIKLREAAKSLAAGNLQTRVVPVIGKRRDEIGKLARDFDEMAERIESLITSQKRLTRDVSHELRSPLARLNVALELAKQKSSPETHGLLDRIEREGKRLNEMISQILTLSKLESQAETIEKKDVNLCRLVEKVVADANFEAAAQNKKVEITKNAECTVVGSETLLRSAVENVLRNALRYAKNKVEVKLEKTKNAIVIEIKDDGEGVSEDELDKLFTPFYRVGEARERKSGGVGLGLAITEQAVVSHKGAITAKNAANGGLLIEIKLPANAAPSRTTERIR